MKWSHDNRGCEGTIYHIDYIWFAGASFWTCATREMGFKKTWKSVKQHSDDYVQTSKIVYFSMCIFWVCHLLLCSLSLLSDDIVYFKYTRWWYCVPAISYFDSSICIFLVRYLIIFYFEFAIWRVCVTAICILWG